MRVSLRGSAYLLPDGLGMRVLAPASGSSGGLILSPNDLTVAPWATTSGGDSVVNDAGITLPDSTTGTASHVTTASGDTEGIEYAVSPAGGTASTQFSVSCWARAVSGTVTVRLKNTQGGVADNFGSDVILTTSWTQLSTFQVSNGGSAGSGAQIFGIVNGSAGTACQFYAWGFTASTP